jgi:hypothetical protein
MSEAATARVERGGDVEAFVSTRGEGAGGLVEGTEGGLVLLDGATTDGGGESTAE